MKLFFKNWRKSTSQSLHRKYLKEMEPGRVHHDTKLLRLVLSKLTQNAIASKSEKQSIQAALDFQKGVWFRSWLKCTILHQERRHDDDAAILFNRLTILHQSWLNWKKSQDLVIVKCHHLNQVPLIVVDLSLTR